MEFSGFNGRISLIISSSTSRSTLFISPSTHDGTQSFHECRIWTIPQVCNHPSCHFLSLHELSEPETTLLYVSDTSDLVYSASRRRYMIVPVPPHHPGFGGPRKFKEFRETKESDSHEADQIIAESRRIARGGKTGPRIGKIGKFSLGNPLSILSWADHPFVPYYNVIMIILDGHQTPASAFKDSPQFHIISCPFPSRNIYVDESYSCRYTNNNNQVNMM